VRHHAAGNVVETARILAARSTARNSAFFPGLRGAQSRRPHPHQVDRGAARFDSHRLQPGRRRGNELRQEEELAEQQAAADAAQEKLQEIKTRRDEARGAQRSELEQEVSRLKSQEKATERRVTAAVNAVRESQAKFELAQKAPVGACTVADVRASESRYLSACQSGMPSGSRHGATWSRTVNVRDHRDNTSRDVRIECRC
jgi:hypothetical protein